jgi:hypothetical protein
MSTPTVPPTFDVHTARSPASRGARAYLRTVAQSKGFVPNLFGLMAESETALKAYGELSR